MHDMNGTPVTLGAKVLVPMVVTQVSEGTDFCNCTLESAHPMFPGDSKTACTFNTKQILVVPEGEVAPYHEPRSVTE
jgi:hypothetical protein